MFHSNYYMVYSDYAKNRVREAGFSQKMFTSELLELSGLYAGLVMEAPLEVNQHLLKDSKNAKLTAMGVNAKSMQYVALNKFPVTCLRNRLNMYSQKQTLMTPHHAEFKRLKVYEVLGEVLRYIYNNLEYEKGITDKTNIPLEYISFLTEGMLNSNLEELFNHYEESIKAMSDINSPTFLGYCGVSLPYTIESENLIKQAKLKNSKPINTTLSGNYDKNDIINYSVGLCIKKRDKVGLFYLVMVAYSECLYNLMAIVRQKKTRV